MVKVTIWNILQNFATMKQSHILIGNFSQVNTE